MIFQKCESALKEGILTTSSSKYNSPRPKYRTLHVIAASGYILMLYEHTYIASATYVRPTNYFHVRWEQIITA
jgi:hypothetical protein